MVKNEPSEERTEDKTKTNGRKGTRTQLTNPCAYLEAVVVQCMEGRYKLLSWQQGRF